MSTIAVTNLKHESASGNNITLDSSGNVSIENNKWIQAKDSGGTARNVLAIDAYNGLNINSAGGGAAAPIVFKLNGTETARFTTSGGLCFNGDTAAANALDDYEEGTFTVTGQDQSGNVFPSYTGTPLGVYTKIGRLVHVTIQLRTGASTSGMNTGEQLRITGLPFTPGTYGLTYVHCYAGLTALSPATYLGLLASNTGTSLDIFATGGDASAPYVNTNFTVANFENGNGAYININAVYYV